MKLDIDTCPKEFYGEFLDILYQINGIKRKPNKKVKRFLKGCYWMIIFCLVCLFLCFYSDITNKSIFNIFDFWIIFLVCIIIDYKLKLKNLLNKGENVVINIDEYGIEDIEKDKVVKISYDSIEKIVINKYSICAIPKDMTGIMIGIPIEYKDQFLEGISIYDKSNLVIDNSNLYK